MAVQTRTARFLRHVSGADSVAGMETHSPRAVRRAALPQVLFPDDVGVVLQIDEEAARQAIRRGDCGPFLEMGGRVAVLRETFLAHLKDLARPQDRRIGGGPRG
jgi:hypothetical protein